MHNKGFSYSAINTAKSALLTLVSIDGCKNWGDNKDLVNFFKGLYNIKPPLPKYTHTWDADTVINYLELLYPLDKLTLKEITLKTLGLIALTSGNRAQSIHLMDLNFMTKQEDCFIFLFKARTKTTKQGVTQPHLEVRRLKEHKCCVYTTLEEYIRRTKELRTSSDLWISPVKPYKPVGRQTISRWLKELLKLAGIDTAVYNPHSTRMAAVSKAHKMGVGMHTILKTAGWRTESNFKKFYLRKTVGTSNRGKFAEAVLATAK